MKKIKFTFWLLGFGCGMAFTGILGTFISLKVVPMSIVQETHKSLSEDVAQSEGEMPTQLSQVDENAQNQQSNINGDGQESESLEQEALYREIDIPSVYSASEICQLLQEEGIVEDGKAFLEYIRERKLQRYLQDGHLKLPLNASYEELLNELIVINE